jgi:outer membrane protein OmpA-like peptidoglycan-associated protein
MSINLNQLVQGALTESVLQQIAQRIGCAPEAAKRVVSLCGPALIGSMMNKASSPEGARSLFAAIMSPSTNAQIADDLPHAVVRDDEFKSLLASGANADSALASHDGLNQLAARVSEYTGVAASSARTLMGVVGATVLGVLKRYFAQHNAQVGHLPGLLGHQLPVVRANMTEAFAQALGLGSVGAFLAGVMSRLKAVSAQFDHPGAQAQNAFPVHTDLDLAEPQAVVNADEPGHRKTWMWVASAAALALIAVLSTRGCAPEKPVAKTAADTSSDADNAAAKTDDASAAVAASAAALPSAQALDTASAPAAAAPAPSQGAIMAASVDASGVPTINATVGSEQEKQRLLDLLAVKLGLDKFHAKVTVDPDTKSAAWLDKLGDLTPVLTQPGAQLRIAGDDIQVSGTAADAKFGWLDKLKSLFGAGWNIGLVGGAAAPVAASTPVVEQAAQPAVQQATQAVPAGDKCSTENLASTLNLKTVNFRLGSKTLPDASLAALSKSARALKACSSAAKPIKLEIAGYTDTTGNEASNLQLSKQRAQVVRAYLVKQGVPASSLTAAGFGQASPIADNNTREGRMANRRIELKIAN